MPWDAILFVLVCSGGFYTDDASACHSVAVTGNWSEAFEIAESVAAAHPKTCVQLATVYESVENYNCGRD